jgi:hypothetical protein
MAGRVRPEEPPVQHVREPGERVPGPGVEAGQRPGQGTGLHLTVRRDVALVLEGQEVVPQDGPEGDHDQQGQDQADDGADHGESIAVRRHWFAGR